MAALEPVAEGGAEGAAGALAFGLGFFFWILAAGWNQTIGAGLRSVADAVGSVRVGRLLGHGRIFGPLADALYSADSAVHRALVAVANENFRAGRWFFNASARAWTDLAETLAHVAVSGERAFAHFEEVTLPRWVGHALAHTGAFAVWLLKEARHEGQAVRDWTRHEVRRVDALAHRTAIALPRDVARVRSRVGRLEHDVAGEKVRLERLAALATLAGFSAFMWRWMGRYGLRWLRCPSLARAGSAIGCGGFALLEDLLAASFLALAVSDICDTMVAVTKLAEWFRPLLMDLVDVEDQLIGCGASKRDPLGFTKPELLGLPKLYLPAVADPLPLSFT